MCGSPGISILSMKFFLIRVKDKGDYSCPPEYLFN